MVSSGALFTDRVVSGAGGSPQRTRRARRPLTARRILRLCRRTIKFVLLVTWEVTKLAVRVAWALFCIYLYAFLKLVSFVMRAT